ncbi:MULTISPECIES: energy transducer TonB [Pseudanabaena]|uniref:energy transducer TonB n=1 Tax=Pseudanabaena TaxID=1152 RepID=UPI00247983FF|nr:MULTISPECIES: energy transducer TonB [Pseudanabaena]MEA5489378.1 energy transducer TonB [Pseudanabaena sp. CCNP1317]WGS72788.1 energy transducer TonB [Pseudanabaena galeata CCNP1313]
MLPTEPKSEITVIQTEQPMLNSKNTVVANNPMRQFANKVGGLIMKYPFGVLVLSSLGIHAAFALVAPNPLKKPEPREVVVSTLPVVKLPPKTLTTNSKTNKSLIDNLFVKSAPKTNSPLNPFPDISSSSPLTTLDLDSFSNFEDLPPVADPFSVPPLPDDIDKPQFVKPKSPVPTPPKNPPTQPRFNQSEQIDNTSPPPVKQTDNIKPEYQNGGLKKDVTSPPATTKKSANGEDANSTRNLQGAVAANSSNSDRPEKEIGNISALYTTDKQIIDLLSKNLIRNTQIAPADALISNPDLNREKGVTWIPPKVANTSGKSGSVTFMWLVDPSGEVQTRFLKSSGIKELDDIARETVKDYKFKPIEDPQSGKYRLVTAKYDFP